jgi:ABC-type proline/glycine betaine transport system ATPase subunit
MRDEATPPAKLVNRLPTLTYGGIRVNAVPNGRVDVIRLVSRIGYFGSRIPQSVLETG